MMTRHNDPFLDEFLVEMMAAGMNIEHLADVAGSLPAMPPSTMLRQRLMKSLSVGGRLHRFATQTAELLDVTVERAMELLDGIDDSSVWERGPAEDVTLYHFSGGPAVAEAITGFVCVERGKAFPHHSHLGNEAVLILQGTCRDSADDSIYRPGDITRATTGAPHRVDVLPGPKLIYLAVVFGGIDIDGLILTPGDPRI
jgi:quercetin dioxygenase-like cupin family protein